VKSEITAALHDLVLSCRVGCSDEERARPQLVTINLQFVVDAQGAEVSDDVADTVNYSEVLKLIQQMCADRSWKILEKMTFDVGAAVLERFSKVISLTISVKKHVFANTSGVSVTRSLSR
jgi:FolB domain-containing protein